MVAKADDKNENSKMDYTFDSSKANTSLFLMKNLNSKNKN